MYLKYSWKNKELMWDVFKVKYFWSAILHSLFHIIIFQVTEGKVETNIYPTLFSGNYMWCNVAVYNIAFWDKSNVFFLNKKNSDWINLR